jgi:hypothetical protein
LKSHKVVYIFLRWRKKNTHSILKYKSFQDFWRTKNFKV